MKSPKVKTQKNLSALIAIALAAVTLLSAGAANSTEPTSTKVNLVEAEIIADVEQMLIEDFGDIQEEEINFDEEFDNVKVFDSNNELLAQGNSLENKELRTLVNKAELISEIGDTKYYSIVK